MWILEHCGLIIDGLNDFFSYFQERIVIKDKKFDGDGSSRVADNVAVINAIDKTAILEKADVKQISQVSLAGENKDMEVEVKVTIAQLPTTQPIDSMIKGRNFFVKLNFHLSKKINFTNYLKFFSTIIISRS